MAKLRCWEKKKIAQFTICFFPLNRAALVNGIINLESENSVIYSPLCCKTVWLNDDRIYIFGEEFCCKFACKWKFTLALICYCSNCKHFINA